MTEKWIHASTCRRRNFLLVLITHDKTGMKGRNANRLCGDAQVLLWRETRVSNTTAVVIYMQVTGGVNHHRRSGNVSFPAQVPSSSECKQRRHYFPSASWEARKQKQEIREGDVATAPAPESGASAARAAWRLAGEAEEQPLHHPQSPEASSRVHHDDEWLDGIRP